MYFIRQSRHYLRRANKIIRNNPRLDAAVSRTITALTHDPFMPILRTHGVIARLDGRKAMSSFVTKDLRIIWRFAGNGDIRIIALIDIGGHSGGKGVY